LAVLPNKVPSTLVAWQSKIKKQKKNAREKDCECAIKSAVAYTGETKVNTAPNKFNLMKTRDR
jgi:hypothetical protein